MTGGRAAGPRRLLVAAGALVMAYAVVGALLDPDVPPVGGLVFLAAGLAVHDAVLLPLVIGAGVVAGRFLPAGARAAVQVAGFVTVAVLVVALPLVLGFGRRPDDPSALPLDYGRGLAAALLLVWSAALVVVLRRTRRRRRPGDAGGPAAG